MSDCNKVIYCRVSPSLYVFSDDIASGERSFRYCRTGKDLPVFADNVGQARSIVFPGLSRPERPPSETRGVG